MYLGIDVGTGSARAGIFAKDGKLISSASTPITIKNPQPDYFEQDATEIWDSVCSATKEAIRLGNECLSRNDVGDIIEGVGFDATCSLVLLDSEQRPCALKEAKNSSVIMWCDHRATKQADILSKSGNDILKTTGGQISPEMSVAKVCWLYQESRDLFNSVACLLELPDFLVFKATGSVKRSLNSLVCKWGYDGSRGWDSNFWKCLVDESYLNQLYKKCGGLDELGKPSFVLPGALVCGLTEEAANLLGLRKGIAVGGPLIDAYSGALGTLGMKSSNLESVSKRMAIIAGTSSCHILVQSSPLHCKGVWGPYSNVLFPDSVCMEGGQTLTGKAIVLIMQRHPEWKTFSAQSTDVFADLNSLIARDGLKSLLLQTTDLHVLPDLHGNRSPIANASIRGVIVGLDVDQSLQSLCKLYLATLLSLCYGTLHIIDSLKTDIEELVLSGGLTSNELFMQLLASVCRRSVLLPRHDAVLCGSAMLGYAASVHPNDNHALKKAMLAMSGYRKCFVPLDDEEQVTFHKRKYAVFLEMYSDFLKYQQIMRMRS